MSPSHRTPQGVLRALALVMILVPLVPLAPRTAVGDAFTVLNSSNSGTGSLRQGVLDSNAVAGPNTLSFSGPPANSTIQLVSPLANIASDLTINGSPPGGLTLAGNGTTFLTVNAGKKLRLNDVTFDAGDLLLGTAAQLTLDVSTGTTTIDEVIGDASVGAGGILEKAGAGTLILSGANTFSGNALVGAGTLEVTTTSLISNANVSTGATLRFLETPDGSYAGVITGAGSVVKAGTNTLTLTSTNSYTGGTTIQSGTLTGTVGPIQGNIAIQSGATLDINDLFDRLYTGTLSGSGMLMKSGAGKLILAPSGVANTWTTAQINLGSIQGAAAAISGDVNIAGTAATLFVDEPGTGTVAGDLSGPGLFQKIGVGTVTLTGDNTGLTNTTAGAMTVAAGTLIGNTASVPTNVLVQTGATLALNQTTAGSYNSVVTGFGNVEKRGAGRLTFAAGQTYAGTTSILGGRLDVLGGLASSSTSIASGATLGGTGSLAGSVANSGRIAPGTSIGTLTVDSVSFASGATLEIEVDPSPAADRLVVSNAANLAGGVLDLRPAAGTYTAQTSTILTAGTISGSLAFVDNFPLLDISLLQVGNTLQVTVNSNGASFAQLARNANQRAVGTALDSAAPTASPDLQLVLQGFASLTTNEFSAALDSLSGETLSQFATARSEHADRFDAALHSRLREASDSLEAPLYPGRRKRRGRGEGLLPDVSAPEADAARIELWFVPYAAFGDIDGSRGASDVDYTLFGGALGAEAAPFANSRSALRDVRMGAAFAYGNSDIDFDDRNGGGDAHSYMGALYGGWSNGRLRAGLSGRVGYTQMDSERTITIGSLVRSAEAELDGLDFGARVEAGAKWLENERWLLESYGSLDYNHLDRDSVSETGAGSVNLQIGKEKLDALRVGIGTRLRGIVRLDADLSMMPELRAEWQQQLLDRDRRVEANFSGAPGVAGFSIRGAELPSHSAVVGVGWSVRSESGFEARVDYDLGINARRIAHAVGVRVGTHW